MALRIFQLVMPALIYPGGGTIGDEFHEVIHDPVKNRTEWSSQLSLARALSASLPR